MPSPHRVADAPCLRLLPAFLCLAVGAWGAAPASAARFSFRSIEYAPAEERMPAARAYLRDHAAPGTPMRAAIAALRHAEAGCSARTRADGMVRCRHSVVASDSFADQPIGDITWTVELRPAADGTVASASVTRERAGF